jgi:hypothetical protein
MEPSYPKNEIIPAIEMKDAADIQSAAVGSTIGKGRNALIGNKEAFCILNARSPSDIDVDDEGNND